MSFPSELRELMFRTMIDAFTENEIPNLPMNF